MIKDNFYLVIIGLVASAYITIFYDLFKHIIKNYLQHVSPIVDTETGLDAFAGLASVGIGIGVVLALKREKKKNGKKPET